MTNFEWLNSIHQILPRQWHNDVVISSYDIENHDFYEVKSQFRAIINPSLIKGIDYAFDYNCNNIITWVELLNSLIRFDTIKINIKTYEGLISHVHSDYNELKTLKKYGDIYITTVGQHRMALAKFLEINEVEVDVIEYQINNDKYNRYKTYQHYLEELSNVNFLKKDEPGANKDYCNLLMFIIINDRYCTIDINMINPFLKEYNSLKSYGYLNKILYFYSKMLNPITINRIEINNLDDITKIRHLMRKHKFESLHL